METILLAITIGALLVAVIMGAAAWRLSRLERARSGARVAALAAEAATADATTPTRAAGVTAPARTAPEPHSLPEFPTEEPQPVSPTLESRAPWTPARVSAFTPARAAVAPVTRVPDLALHTAVHDAPLPAASAAIADSFLGSDAGRPGNGRQRVLAVAAAMLFVVLGGAGYWLISGGRAPNNAAVAASAPSNAPLELMSLRHERTGSRLSLSGLVRNPSGGAAVEGLSAVVFLFDAQGAFITSARTGVDFKRLAPGDESPFVITVDAPSNVARYRVSFRTDAGILAHVDRRSELPATTTSIATTKS